MLPISQARERNFQKSYYKTFSTSCRPRLYAPLKPQIFTSPAPPPSLHPSLPRLHQWQLTTSQRGRSGSLLTPSLSLTLSVSLSLSLSLSVLSASRKVSPIVISPSQSVRPRRKTTLPFYSSLTFMTVLKSRRSSLSFPGRKMASKSRRKPL